MKLNINYTVRVRLTDVGRALHRKNWDALFAKGRHPEWEYTPPKESADGWWETQLWLARHFDGEESNYRATELTTIGRQVLKAYRAGKVRQ